MHHDFDDADGKTFNLLVGIEAPEGAGPELVVQSDSKRRGEIRYGADVGVIVGDETFHGTRECDHRAHRGFRLACTIYLADLNEKSLSGLARDESSVFPPTGETKWIWSQRGRHWRKEGGRSLENDLGRSPLQMEDEITGCEERKANGECLVEGIARDKCLKTCDLFIDDYEYRPGEERSKVMGY